MRLWSVHADRLASRRGGHDENLNDSSHYCPNRLRPAGTAVMDGAAREPQPDGLDWNHLGGASGAMPGPEELRRSRGQASGEELPPVDPLPPGRLLAEARRLAAVHEARDRIFGRAMFPNPAWNILIDLYIGAEEGRNVTIKSACVAARVPQSTALRHIAHLVDVQLIARAQHPSDARSAYLTLTDGGRAKMRSFITLSAAAPGAPPA